MTRDGAWEKEMKTPRTEYQCDLCKRWGVWSQTWQRYGSVAQEEERPQDMFVTCSDKCREAFETKLNTGEIKVPRVKYHGYKVIYLGERKGY
jgi:hypothetical protein